MDERGHADLRLYVRRRRPNAHFAATPETKIGDSPERKTRADSDDGEVGRS